MQNITDELCLYLKLVTVLFLICGCTFSLLIKFRADEEPVDQKKYLEESCKPKCVKPLLEYEVKFSSSSSFLKYVSMVLFAFCLLI